MILYTSKFTKHCMPDVLSIVTLQVRAMSRYAWRKVHRHLMDRVEVTQFDLRSIKSVTSLLQMKPPGFGCVSNLRWTKTNTSPFLPARVSQITWENSGLTDLARFKWENEFFRLAAYIQHQKASIKMARQHVLMLLACDVENRRS